MLHVIARMSVKPGKMSELLKLLEALVPQVRAEEGCIRYEVCLDADSKIGVGPDKQALTILETWESEAHLEAHLAAPHMATYREQSAGLRDRSQLTLLSSRI
ncbi:MAG: antibiotic biosynthesis monooxygenase [Oligosphaeraceae bacterium]|jgi:quinol monooxygenase YgiN|nr:antibiotic biosynthesis monooxygenase [Oligosphaeraceae bacterium]